VYKVYPYNFAGLSNEEFTRYETSRVVVVPFPYDSTTSWRAGAREGPAAVIRASRNMELFDLELRTEIYRAMGIHTMNEIAPSMASPEENAGVVAEVFTHLLEDGKFPVMLGGEHSLTVGAVRACKERFGELSVLYLDAHADLREEYEGSRYGHGSVALRIMEDQDIGCPVSLVGVRSMSEPEHLYIEARSIPLATAEEIFSRPETSAAIVDGLTDRVYVSIDLDVFDPSEMPSVGTPEPGGLRWRQVLDILRLVAIRKEVIAFDAVELCPNPLNVAPDFLAASLIYKFLGYIFCNR
jgi:agmatinase